MCGIFFTTIKDKIHDEVFEKIKKTVSDRGPDKLLHFNEKKFEALMSVLSITRDKKKEIKKSEFITSKHKIILFNGEIYNWLYLKNKFKVSGFSDTEVLSQILDQINLENLAPLINGMFSILVVSSDEVELITDPRGEKRLFYFFKDNQLTISSELKNILLTSDKLKANLNKDKILEYLSTRHFLTYEKTIFNDINVTIPGSYIKFNFNKSPYRIVKKNLINYEQNLNLKQENFDIKYLIESFRNVANLLTPNVPYCSVASGGIDSTLATYYLMRTKTPPNFTIGLSFKDSDEHTKRVNELLKNLVPHKIFEISLDDFAENLDSTINRLCHPLPTHSFTSQLMLAKFAKAEGAKVIIGGDGGDEFFGGYELYKKMDLDNNLKYSISPYSSYDEKFLRKLGLKGSSHNRLFYNNLWTKTLQKWNMTIGKGTDAIYKAAFDLDQTLQLSSTGFYASDIMTSSVGIEGRNFYANQLITNLTKTYPLYKLLDLENNITRPFIKKVFYKNFSRNEFTKQGFSGYPNEAGHILLKDQKFEYVSDYLEIIIDKDFNRSEEWKLINLELFLRNL